MHYWNPYYYVWNICLLFIIEIMNQKREQSNRNFQVNCIVIYILMDFIFKRSLLLFFIIAVLKGGSIRISHASV